MSSEDFLDPVNDVVRCINIWPTKGDVFREFLDVIKHTCLTYCCYDLKFEASCCNENEKITNVFIWLFIVAFIILALISCCGFRCCSRRRSNSYASGQHSRQHNAQTYYISVARPKDDLRVHLIKPKINSGTNANQLAN